MQKNLFCVEKPVTSIMMNVVLSLSLYAQLTALPGHGIRPCP